MIERKELSDESKKIVNINCSYIPPELITASGYNVRRIWPGEIADKGQDLLPINYCPYSRAFLSQIIDGQKETIIANSCDAMRRVYDAQNNKSFLLQVPRKIREIDVNFYKNKLEDMKNVLLNDAKLNKGRNDGEEKNSISYKQILIKEIKKFNEIRILMTKLRNKLLDNDEVSFSLLIDALNNHYYNKNKKGIKKIIKKVEKNKIENNLNKKHEKPGTKPRTIISSSCLLDKSLVKKVEKAGLKVVALDSCLGERSFDFGVKLGGESPLKSLANAYLEKAPCPRMMEIDRRLEKIKNLISERKASGLIYFIPKFCNQASYDFKYIKDWAQENNFPLLKLEGEYNAGLSGKLTTIIEAFKESLEFALVSEV